LQLQLEKKNENLKYMIKERKNAQSELKRSHSELEQRVIERTAKLKKVNVGLTNEIAQRKQTEEALKESEHRLRAEIEERKHREEELRHAQENLKKQLQFEKLISRLSSEFINLPHDQIDNKIESGQKLTAETLDFDRSLFHEFSKDRKFLHVTHIFLKPGIKRPPSTITSEAQPWLAKTILNRKIAKIERINDLPDEAEMEKNYLLKQDVKSAIAIPLIVGGEPIGALTFTSVFSDRSWPDEDVRQLKLISDIFANALDRKQKEQSLQSSFLEIKQLKDRLQQENIYLKEEVKLEHRHNKIIGKSPAINYVLRQVEQVAKTQATILIQGETGTGKELLAQAIHNLSSRKDRVMVTVNCSALPAGLIESELFGREKGAYTGALAKQLGRFEIANGSTIFLDEIGELQLELQTKLLRVLQEFEFQRLGSTETIKVDVRVIAASNRNLSKAVSDGFFREDLFYRLNVFPIIVPPLRERKEDIPLLVWTFVNQFEKTMGKRITTIQQSRMEEMLKYAWPGNVRELRNVVEHSMIVSKDTTLNLRVPETATLERTQDISLDTVERNHITTILEQTGWRVKGNNGAAELLGLNPATLYSKMKKLGIKRTTNQDDISSPR
jgi:formate hydrogenlyase transcriptional activator